MFCGTLTITGGHVPPPILKIEPGDVVVIQCPCKLTQEFMTTLREKTKELFPGHRVVVFGDGIHYTTVRDLPANTQALPSTDHKTPEELGRTHQSQS